MSDQGPMDHPDWGVIRIDGKVPTKLAWDLAKSIAITGAAYDKGIEATRYTPADSQTGGDQDSSS